MAICNRIHIKITWPSMVLDRGLRDVAICHYVLSQYATIPVPPALCDYVIFWEPLCGQRTLACLCKVRQPFSIWKFIFSRCT